MPTGFNVFLFPSSSIPSWPYGYGSASSNLIAASTMCVIRRNRIIRQGHNGRPYAPVVGLLRMGRHHVHRE